MASVKRCHYEVLGLQRECAADEIRSAYKRLALQRHPDKLVQSGLSQAEATAQFQELQHAYEVLSDQKERAWYDSHRSQILFSDPNSVGSSVPNSFIPDLFSFFSNTVYSGYSDYGKGFYKVYSDVFDKIHANEINLAKKLGLGVDSVRQAPLMGNLESPYAQMTAFYNHWLGFSTVMDFCWVDQYDVMAGPNRKSRRVMEDENKKLRKMARKEYNETVRGLAEFVKKRDKRVIDMMIKKNLEIEKRKEEERERKKKLEKEKMARAMAYEEPEWAKVEDDREDEAYWFEESEQEKRKDAEKELYCVVCGKKFKSEKQWKNHEQSKKHKEKVAKFRDSLGDEERFEEDVEVEFEGEGKGEGKEILESGEEGVRVNDNRSGGANSEIDDLEVRVKEDLHIAEEDARRGGVDFNSDEDGYFDSNDAKKGEQIGEFVAFDDGDVDVLEGMVAGHKSRKNATSKHEVKVSETSIKIDNESDEYGFKEQDRRKSTRKNRGAKKEKCRKFWEDSPIGGVNVDYQNFNNIENGNSHTEKCSFQSFVEEESNGKENEQIGRHEKTSNQPYETKRTGKGTKSKARKAKVTSKTLTNVCEKCGEEFDSRNKLHKHLGDSGHATLKYR